jgi:hypothetical protein
VGQYYGAASEAVPDPLGAGGAGGPAAETAPTGGPAIALADDAPAPKLIVAVPYRKLLEVTHFHLYTVPVFLLILTHLFMLTGLSARTKQVWITLGWSAATLHMLAPWLIRGSAQLSWLFPLSGALLLLSGTVLTVYPAWVMWQRPKRSVRPARPPEPEPESEPDSASA